ncbi:small GTP-binding protein [Histomonas meleagridis]|uniref:small GTP-binding protein n=1 Tax=Histomonas meleagridis TaxID=135588 RepID=UPI00355988FD|nr:small GTP-binding protein [Histomonas meleagridis]KAH0799820.1 small GTP-binding protein [Histomonas meleagridis]
MTQPQYRVVLVGSSCVGKTAIITRRVKGEKPSNYSETIGAAFFTYKEKIDDEEVEIQVWDTAGQEKYRALGPVYFRNANAGIFVYDVTDQESFNSLQFWITSFQETAGVDIPIFIVGNKVDLEDNIVVEISMGQKFAQDHGYSFFPTSAVTGRNINFLFQKVADTVYHQGDQFVHKKNNIQPGLPEANDETKCC